MAKKKQFTEEEEDYLGAEQDDSENEEDASDQQTQSDPLEELVVSAPVYSKQVGATKDDPNRMTSATPQSQKDAIEPGEIVEHREKWAEGIVVRKKIPDDSNPRRLL